MFSQVFDREKLRSGVIRVEEKILTRRLKGIDVYVLGFRQNVSYDYVILHEQTTDFLQEVSDRCQPRVTWNVCHLTLTSLCLIDDITIHRKRSNRNTASKVSFGLVVPE